MEFKLMRILYNSKNTIYKSKFGTLCENEGCTLNIYIPKNCKTVRSTLVFNREDNSRFSTYCMEKNGEYEEYEIFSCDVSFARAGLFFYYFVIETENEKFSLYKQGYDMTNMEDGDYWQLSVIPNDFNVSEEFVGRVMYQIFPDRFNKSGGCDVSAKLKPFLIHDNIVDVPYFLPDEKGVVQNNDFFGGNLKGITEKIGYLKSLNVGIIYLNPIFKAYSNHRYDTADYKKIDELLGTEEDFKELCLVAHAEGIKIILDGVFSHTGSNSIYFDSESIFGNGAVSNPASPYRAWFNFKHYPNDYTSWWGIKTLPCVDENNESYKKYIINDEDSVVAHWLRLGADGFRLDVADELPDSFIQALRKRMKEIKKSSFLIGEVWEDASNKCSYGVRRKYFTEGELDSVMNYPFKNAIIDFVLGKDGGYSFRDTVMSIAENYPDCVLKSMMNVLSTHDTVRIITALGVKDVPPQKRERALYRMSEAEWEIAKSRLFLAVFLQFVLPGNPCIYYGDEIGTQGFEDPFCRSFFQWHKTTKKNDILSFYKEITALKASSEILNHGHVNVFIERHGVSRIERTLGETVLTAFANVGDEALVIETDREVLLSKNVFFEGNKKIIKIFGFILLS